MFRVIGAGGFIINSVKNHHKLHLVDWPLFKTGVRLDRVWLECSVNLEC